MPLSDLVEATNNASTTINMVGGLSNSATTITGGLHGGISFYRHRPHR
jgi:hypothetical protein